MDEASPRFRQDLEASATEAEGVACVDVRDPHTGTSFRFYDFEYQLALQFNGQPVRDVIAWAAGAFGADLTVDGVNEFAGRLSELGFLEATAGAPVPAGATPAAGMKTLEGPDSAEHEWMAEQGAKTATFVPDAAMLDSPADLTPVAPDLPRLEAEAEAEAASIDVTTDVATTAPPDKAKAAQTTAEIPVPAPRLFDLLAPGVAAKAASPTNEAPTLPPLPAVQAPPATATAPAPLPAKPAASWASDLEGKLQEGAPDTRTPPPLSSAPPPPPALKAPPPAALAPPGNRAVPAPPGLPERRQPPAPEAVLMTAFSEDAAGGNKEKKRGGRAIAIVILLLAIAGIGYVAWTYERAHRLPQAVRVRVLSPRPMAAYLWFSGSGTVTDHEARTLGFDSAGTLGELLPPGTAFGADDILGRLRGAQPIEALLNRHRARVAFYQQMRESMRTANNQIELRQAEIKLAEKQRLVEEGTAALAKLVIRASEPGEIVETLSKVGTPVRASAPVVRVKGRMLHGAFEIDREEIASAGKLSFCRVEVIGLGPRASNREPTANGSTAADTGSPEAQAAPRFVDCTMEKPSGDGKTVRVTLPDNLGLVPGQPLRLARQRFDAVFPVPAATVGGSTGRRSIWVVSPTSTAERREVVVADVSGDALVSEGLRIGDELILDPPADLRPGAPVVVQR